MPSKPVINWSKWLDRLGLQDGQPFDLVRAAQPVVIAADWSELTLLMGFRWGQHLISTASISRQTFKAGTRVLG